MNIIMTVNSPLLFLFIVKVVLLIYFAQLFTLFNIYLFNFNFLCNYHLFHTQ